MKEGALPSTKKLVAEKIARLAKKQVTMFSVKGGSLPRTKNLIAKKIESLVKKPSAEKPKTKLPSIQSSKCTKPRSVTKVSMKGGVLPSIKKLIAKK